MSYKLDESPITKIDGHLETLFQEIDEVQLVIAWVFEAVSQEWVLEACLLFFLDYFLWLTFFAVIFVIFLYFGEDELKAMIIVKTSTIELIVLCKYDLISVIFVARKFELCFKLFDTIIILAFRVVVFWWYRV